ncbi:GIY-YIG nuclease family protein [Streptomyces griseoluteus]
MTELTVKCGCGRTMTPDGRRGYGAFRCGCGLAIQISGEPASPGPRCVGEDAGKPCRMPVITDRPFLLCRNHYRSSGLKQFHEWITMENEQLARAVVDFNIQQLIDDADDEFTADFHRRVQESLNNIRLLQDNPELARKHAWRNDPENCGSVYYVRHGNSVKIGKSVNVRRRMDALTCAIPGAELLATEPGYTERERSLHSKFSFYRQAGEWFALGPGLVDYINKLRRAAGQKPIDVPPEHVDKIRSTL